MMNSCGGRAHEASPLGNDLMLKILSNLPVKSLMKSKCVCKSWQSLIESDPHFIHLHLTVSKTRPIVLISSTVKATSFSSAYLSEVIDHGEAVYRVTAPMSEHMLKPVNGLICFVRHFEPAVLIYNLSTREETPWIERTTVEREEVIGYRRQFYGFGFDPATKEHKVVHLFMKKPLFPWRTRDYFGNDNDFCEVLTVGQNIWRRIDGVPPHKVCHEAFYAHGALYWLCDGNNLDDASAYCIVVFDVGSEKFIRVIPIPNFICHSWTPYYDFLLLNVDERLALVCRTIIGGDNENGKTIKMWIFDHNNWIEETISLPCEEERAGGQFSFEAIEGTDLIMIQSNRKTMEPVVSVYYYDMKKKTWTVRPRGGLTIKSAPPCGEICTLDKPFDRFPFNYNISTFVESLFPVQNQQKRFSSGGV